MTNRRGFVSREAESFACAFRGIAALLRSEVHARIHLLATVVVIVLGWWFEITAGQWIAAVLAIGLVWVAEALHTARITRQKTKTAVIITALEDLIRKNRTLGLKRYKGKVDLTIDFDKLRDRRK